MSRGDLPRRILLTCLILLLLALAWGALGGGVRQLPRSDTLGRQVETVVLLASWSALWALGRLCADTPDTGG